MPTFLPSSAQSARPRLVCEVRPGGVVAALADEATGVLHAVSFAALPEGTLAPGPRKGNILNHAAFVAAVGAALEAVQERVTDVTLIVPDSAARVLLLDFDSLPSKAADAMPVVKFRLAKLLPFDAESAAVSYQVLSQRNGLVKVLAVAMPREVLEEYESAVRDAGFEPGSVLPSTLAAVGAVKSTEAALLVNADATSVTTAIVRRGDVLLHRTVDLAARAADTVEIAAAANEQDAIAEAVIAEIAAEVSAENEMELELHAAMTVAAAYFEDTVGVAPRELFAVGAANAGMLRTMAEELGLALRDAVETADLLATATSNIPRSLLAGVRGASAI